jgi:hypothetical protein
VVDLILDRACYADMLCAAQTAENDYVLRLVRAKIDLTNLNIAIRILRMNSGEAGKALLRDALLFGGEIDVEKLVSLLRSKGIKRIIIVSPSSSNFELTSAKAEKTIAAIKAGKGGKRKHAVRFGEPRHMERFRDTVRKFAAENGCEFFDIYDDMKALPNKAELLRPTDGVHLTQKGHEFIAEKTFDYLFKTAAK